MKDVLELGNLLISELSKDSTYIDTITRWIIFYISDKITKYKKAKNDKIKNKLAKECFEAVIKLWEHRTSISYNKRPFNFFEIIFDTLYRLNPNIDNSFFYTNSNKETTSEETEKILKAINSIDKAARLFIKMYINYAIISSSNKNTKKYLKNSIVVKDSNFHEGKLISFLNKELKEKSEKEILIGNINLIKGFNKSTKVLLNIYKEKLNKLKKCT